MSILDMIGIWKGRMALLDPHGKPIAVAPPGVSTFREFENLLADVDTDRSYKMGYDDGWDQCTRDADGSYDEGYDNGFDQGIRRAELIAKEKANEAIALLRTCSDTMSSQDAAEENIRLAKEIRKAIAVLRGIG